MLIVEHRLEAAAILERNYFSGHKDSEISLIFNHRIIYNNMKDIISDSVSRRVQYRNTHKL